MNPEEAGPPFTGLAEIPPVVNSVAGEEGFEPSHAGIKIRCLNQLGDSPIYPAINVAAPKGRALS